MSPIPETARERADTMEEGRPSDLDKEIIPPMFEDSTNYLVQSTVWSPAQAITWSCFDLRPPERIQYIT